MSEFHKPADRASPGDSALPLPVTRNQKAIHLLARTSGKRLGRVRLAKALFLADYHSRKQLGRPITTYEYKYHRHGPWTEQIPEDVRSLEALSLVKEHRYIGLKGPGHYYTAEGELDYSDLEPREVFILHAAVDRCASGQLDRLLEEVYDTAPMRVAKAVGKHARIPMELFDGIEPAPAAVSTETLERSEKELDLGRGLDLKAVIHGLQAGHLADGG